MILIRRANLLLVFLLLIVQNTSCGESEPLGHNNKAGKPSEGDQSPEAPSLQKEHLALTLPATLPPEVNQVKVALTEIQLQPAMPCWIDQSGASNCPQLPPPWSKTYTFSAKEPSLPIYDLSPRQYAIVIDLVNSGTGKSYLHGEGSVLIQEGKTVRAHVNLSPTQDTNGGLVIVLDGEGGGTTSLDPSAAVCTKEARMPSCIRSGGGYKVQAFAKDETCEWQPSKVEVVDNSLCQGLPGYEDLASF
jgi:hypothetical protein